MTERVLDSSGDELTEVEPEFMGFQRKGYPGAFPPKVEQRIRRIVGTSNCLHLFSGTSDIGDVRVDLGRPEGTLNMDVFEFIKTDERIWEFVVADPPYKVKDRFGLKQAYANPTPMNTMRQKLLADYLKGHANNVVWFDNASPCPNGFYVHRFWVYRPGSWHHIRGLTWLKLKGVRLELE